MKSLTLRARAKVNLCLKVRRRRPDGYHEIETLFERISLHDTLRFRPAGAGIRLVCAGIPVGRGPSNLVYRAASLLKSRYGVRKGAVIRLEKRIPVAAGLGGGSSDAAAALLGLDRLWGLGLGRETLLKHALELGSDVPFFILNASYAVGRGRGEKLKVLRPRARLWHVLGFPGLKVPTREIYGALAPSDRDRRPLEAARILSAARGRDAEALERLMTNSLEAVCLRRHPPLGRILGAFRGAGALRAMVSGSGSTVFALAASRREAARIARSMRRHFRVPFLAVSTA